MDFPNLEPQIVRSFDLEVRGHGFPRSGGLMSWIPSIWRSQAMGLLDLGVPGHGFPGSGDPRSWIPLTLRSQITGCLDLEAPDHDFFDLRAPHHRFP